jgi:hypothetical protein
VSSVLGLNLQRAEAFFSGISNFSNPISKALTAALIIHPIGELSIAVNYHIVELKLLRRSLRPYLRRPLRLALHAAPLPRGWG